MNNFVKTILLTACITVCGFIVAVTVFSKQEQKKAPVQEIPGMVCVQAGDFIMGTNEGFDYESPQQRVYLKTFYIDKYEVTNKQYKIFIDKTGYPSPKSWKNNEYLSGKDDCPVVNVSFYDAAAYAKWAGKRLPTEQEWEKAARGTDGRRYPWGDEWSPGCANIRPVFGLTSLKIVGSYPAGVTVYGAYDMSGNVSEWTESFFEAYPLNETTNANYCNKYKVIRGGSFLTTRSMAQTARRDILSPDEVHEDVGFRCVK
jgi:formylglycine-generating enzyme required for sulfatase activity